MFNEVTQTLSNFFPGNFSSLPPGCHTALPINSRQNPEILWLKCSAVGIRAMTRCMSSKYLSRSPPLRHTTSKLNPSMYPPLLEWSYVDYDGWHNQSMESAPLDPNCLQFEATNSGAYDSLSYTQEPCKYPYGTLPDVDPQLATSAIHQRVEATLQEPQDYANPVLYTPGDPHAYTPHHHGPIDPPTAPNTMGCQTDTNNNHFSMNDTGDTPWDPALDSFLLSLHPFNPTANSLSTLPGTQPQDSTLLSAPAHPFVPSPGSLVEPPITPSYTPLYHPIPRTYSHNSLASFSDEIPRLPSVHTSQPATREPSPLPHDPSNSPPNTAEAAQGGELSYDDAVRQFKATKRQRRIMIKSKVTASSGASIQVVDGSSEFAPIFSEHDQMWYCNMCGKGIKRHGDVIRHWRSYNCPVRKAANRGAPKRLVCPFPSCKYSTGRRDGLSRHLNVHRPGGDS
ncbi:hypothetical protein EYR38_001420 [Pleurotus pulmonarius]|nr:hypothetical protein EYR38_001420 [Pleurotus pulmonarius]